MRTLFSKNECKYITKALFCTFLLLFHFIRLQSFKELGDEALSYSDLAHTENKPASVVK